MKGIPQGRYTREFRQEADVGKTCRPLTEAEMEFGMQVVFRTPVYTGLCDR